MAVYGETQTKALAPVGERFTLEGQRSPRRTGDIGRKAASRSGSVRSTKEPMNKHFFFRHYGTIAVIWASVVVVLIVVTMTTGWDKGWQIVMTSAALDTGFVYFMQKQRLDDVKLFHDLFTKFNERYDKLNGTLNAIVEEGDKAELTPRQRHDLNDYFNLCGEEYFFFKQDCIYPEVWEVWNQGMRWFYYNSGRIRLLWQEELQDNRYHGFSLDHLRPSDAGKRHHGSPDDGAAGKPALSAA